MEIKIRYVEPDFYPDGLVWPIEARSIEEAQKIWASQGVTNIKRMSKQECQRLFGSPAST